MSTQEKSNPAEKIFLQTLGQEIDHISAGAEPSYHEKFVPPRSLAILKEITGNGKIEVEDFDYQITRIELKPLRAKQQSETEASQSSIDNDAGHCHKHTVDNPAYKTQMEIVSERRNHRCVTSEDFKQEISCGHYHNAFHIYVDEATEHGYDPLHIIPKFQDDETQILTVEGVDYVLSDTLESVEAYEKIKSRINVPPNASVDLWPEEIVIFAPDESGASKKYIRGDVVYYDAEGGEVDRRLKPRNSAQEETEN